MSRTFHQNCFFKYNIVSDDFDIRPVEMKQVLILGNKKVIPPKRDNKEQLKS